MRHGKEKRVREGEGHGVNDREGAEDIWWRCETLGEGMRH